MSSSSRVLSALPPPLLPSLVALGGGAGMAHECDQPVELALAITLLVLQVWTARCSSCSMKVSRGGYIISGRCG